MPQALSLQPILSAAASDSIDYCIIHLTNKLVVTAASVVT